MFQAFGDAYNLVEPSEKAGEIIAPFCIQNHTGLEILMKLDNSFEVRNNCIPSEVVWNNSIIGKSE